jgi:hypothetical protein
MVWRCVDCDRTYDRPPETCSCGSAAVEPDDGEPGERFSLVAVRRRLLSPGDADRSLVRDDSRVALAFRLIVLVSILTVATAAIVLLI